MNFLVNVGGAFGGINIFGTVQELVAKPDCFLIAVYGSFYIFHIKQREINIVFKFLNIFTDNITADNALFSIRYQ